MPERDDLFEVAFDAFKSDSFESAKTARLDDVTQEVAHRMRDDSALRALAITIRGSDVWDEVAPFITRREDFRAEYDVPGRVFAPMLAGMLREAPGMVDLAIAQSTERNSTYIWEKIGRDRSAYIPVVVGGTGPSGQIFVSQLRNAYGAVADYTASVDKRRHLGGTFRASAEGSFVLNSRTRPQLNEPPVPGTQANINDLRPGVLTPADISNCAYLTAMELGRVIAANQALHANPLTATEIVSISRNLSPSQDLPGQLIMVLERGGERKVVTTDEFIDTSGLNEPSLPVDTPEFLELMQKERAKPLNERRIVTGEELNQLLGSNEVDFPLQGVKEVAVIGDRDTGSVAVGLLTGLEPRVDNSVSQIDWVEKIYWYGQTKENLKEYVAGSRLRYAQLGLEMRRDGEPSRYSRIRARLKADYIQEDEQSNRITVDGEAVDLVVLANGYKNDPVEHLQELVLAPIDVRELNLFNLDGDLLEGSEELINTIATPGRVFTYADGPLAAIQVVGRGLGGIFVTVRAIDRDGNWSEREYALNDMEFLDLLSPRGYFEESQLRALRGTQQLGEMVDGAICTKVPPGKYSSVGDAQEAIKADLVAVLTNSRPYFAFFSDSNRTFRRFDASRGLFDPQRIFNPYNETYSRTLIAFKGEIEILDETVVFNADEIPDQLRAETLQPGDALSIEYDGYWVLYVVTGVDNAEQVASFVRVQDNSEETSSEEISFAFSTFNDIIGIVKQEPNRRVRILSKSLAERLEQSSSEGQPALAAPIAVLTGTALESKLTDEPNMEIFKPGGIFFELESSSKTSRYLFISPNGDSLETTQYTWDKSSFDSVGQGIGAISWQETVKIVKNGQYAYVPIDVFEPYENTEYIKLKQTSLDGLSDREIVDLYDSVLPGCALEVATPAGTENVVIKLSSSQAVKFDDSGTTLLNLSSSTGSRRASVVGLSGEGSKLSVYIPSTYGELRLNEPFSIPQANIELTDVVSTKDGSVIARRMPDMPVTIAGPAAGLPVDEGLTGVIPRIPENSAGIFTQAGRLRELAMQVGQRVMDRFSIAAIATGENFTEELTRLHSSGRDRLTARRLQDQKRRKLTTFKPTNTSSAFFGKILDSDPVPIRVGAGVRDDDLVRFGLIEGALHADITAESSVEYQITFTGKDDKLKISQIKTNQAEADDERMPTILRPLVNQPHVRAGIEAIAKRDAAITLSFTIDSRGVNPHSVVIAKVPKKRSSKPTIPKR